MASVRVQTPARSQVPVQAPTLRQAVQIHWDSAFRIAPTGTTSNTTATRLARPAIVVVGDPSRTRMEQAIGADERMEYAVRAVRTVKISTADAGRDPLLTASNREGPRVVVLGIDGRAISVIPLERVTGNVVYEAVRVAVQEAYGASLDSLVSREREVRRELDRIDVERRALVISPLSDAEWKERTARLDDRRRDLEAKEREIWMPKAKTA